MSKLSDLLMSSGFGNPRDTDDDSDRTMQALHDAILEALFNGGVLPDDLLEKMFGDAAEGNEEQARNQLEELIQQIIERMKESGYISTPPDLEPEKARRAMGGGGEGEPGEVKFEVTDKALDFLGYRALRDLLGSAGHSSAGRHDTRDLSTGIETSGAPKPYEFGDTMNLDVTETILNAVKRQHADAGDRRAGDQGQQGSTSILGPDGRAGRVSELVRDGADARLQPQHDPLRRGPLHARQARGDGAVAPDPHAVSRRHAARGAVPRQRRGDSAARARPRPRRPVLHQHARGPARRAAHPRAAAQGHAADRDDHRRQAVGADAARRPHLQEPVRPRSDRDRRDARRKSRPAPRPAS